MSGSNPFRRSKIITSASTTSSTDESVLPSTPSDAITSAGTACASVNAYDGINETQSSSHHKIVRIATPPLQSPPPTDSTSSYFPAVSFTGLGITAHRGSPPPPAPLQSQLQQPRYDEDSSSDESGPDPFDPRSSDGVDLAIQQRRQQSVEDSSGRTPPKEAKPMNNTLDVDAFTRLLLTGSAEAASSASTSNTTTSRRTASNPDIATATIPLDPPILGQTRIYTNNNETGPNGHDATAAIPRASTFSTATTGSNDVQRTPSLRKPKPPPPRSHHGRPIKPDESGKDPSSSPTPSQTGSPSDRRESISSLSVKVSSSNNELPSTADDASSLHRSSSQSKRPPTPPLSRRHSQMRQSANRHSIAEKPNRLSLPPKSLSQLPGPLSPGPKTPPRPPSRRVERPVSGIPAESSSQLKTSLSQSESTPASDQLSVDEPAFQRLTTTTSSPPSRTPSIKQNPAIMTTATTTMLPPPLPPPRRLRASSKSSSITVSIDNKTDVPITAQTEDIPPSSSQAQDILADLSRLQREVDDLRVHYEGRKVSQ